MADWTFLTNHAMVLVTIARDPDTRMRHVAERIGITERAAHRIVSELIEAGYLTATAWAVEASTRSTSTSGCATR